MLKRTLYGAIFSLLLGFALGSFMYRHIEEVPQMPADAVSEDESSGSLFSEEKKDTAPVFVGAKGVGAGGAVVEELPGTMSPASTADAPDLSRPIVIPPSIPQDAGKAIKARIESLTALLKENPASGDIWLDLAIYRKMIDDFDGTREIWEFLTRIHPDSYLAYSNLASLYALELKDPVRAESYFMQARERGAADAGFFRSLYEFYRYVAKDDEKAKKALSDGLVKNPTASDLKFLLENYEKQ